MTLLDLKILTVVMNLAHYGQCEELPKPHPLGFVTFENCEIPVTDYWSPQRLYHTFMDNYVVRA